MEERFDTWAAGDGYERYMGRWSRLVADAFAASLDVGPRARWIDAGGGTGALARAGAARCRPRLVLGVDRSAAFVAAARATAPGTAAFAVADAQALPVRDGACDAVVSGLALNFLPAPGAAAVEAARAVRPGGLVAAYVWDYAEGMGLLRRFWDAAAAVDPSAAALDEGRRFPLCRPEPLRALWTGAGLTAVEVVLVEVPTVFTGFADLWDPFLAGQGPAPGYVASLAPAARRRLRDTLAGALPARRDGSIALTARAWAVSGRRTGRRTGPSPACGRQGAAGAGPSPGTRC
ncbi:methyltransferase domain-containing protein [Streptomyces sp. NPDC048352]|uniref:methyltransferase domain-containing protein n=1 Tax=Streptomyces sp. NPDC048352 TaxID=3154718 RepID=UPI003423E909